MQLAWSMSLGGASGSNIAASGVVQADAVLTASSTLDPGTNHDLALQMDDVDRVVAVALTASRYDGSVSVKGGNANDPVLALSGPILAFGAAARRLAASLGTLTVTVAAAPATPATVSILVATRLT